MLDLAYLVPLFPLLGVVINTFLTRRASERVVGTIASAMIGLSFLVTAGIFFELLGMDPASRHHELELFTWIAAGKFSASAAFLLDPLSLIMMLVVTGTATKDSVDFLSI
jgi:NADH-quinone oxidoreductase subunit L